MTMREESYTTTFTEETYINRELSWIEFNKRVLEEAMDDGNPLLERIKFVSIFASNLDEFFMIRVSGIKQQVAAGVKKRSPDGLTPDEQLVAIRREVMPVIEQKRSLFLQELMPQLREHGIFLLNYDELQENQREWLSNYFYHQVFPVLTPLAFDPSHPFPHISNLSLNLAVVMCEEEKQRLFARLKVPEVLPRLVPLPEHLCKDDREDNESLLQQCYCFVWLEQLIMAHLSALFPGMNVSQAFAFRVTRDADMEIEEDEADDLLSTIEQGVRQRRFGRAVRMTVSDEMPEDICNLLMKKMQLGPEDVYTMRGPLGLSDLISLSKLNRPDLKDAPIFPGVPMCLHNHSDIFSAIRRQDILLHHPYDSFTPVVEFIQAAAEDPDVLAIKQTLYRVGSNSPIVKALMNARELGKQVSVLVELKARFDEENNIVWARALERAGVHVVYGLMGLKTHCKVTLVVRKENQDIRLYVHLGTGNYNDVTARIYTDLGLFSCNSQLGADAADLFNYLTGYSRQREYRKLLIAPRTLRSKFLGLIERETALHKEQGNGRIIFKMNSLVDPEIIDALYRASQAGVEIELIPRGICCLRPGVPGLSETIRVRSIVGTFLEHTRIYYFRNGGAEEILLGSADLMQRNLDRRVETIFPLEDKTLKEYVRDRLLDAYLRDNQRTRVLQPNGTYHRLSPQDGEPEVDSQRIDMGYHVYEADMGLAAYQEEINH